MSILEGISVQTRNYPAQELREQSARIEALEERMNARIKEIENRLDAAERIASERHSWTVDAIARLADLCELRERVNRIESRQLV